MSPHFQIYAPNPIPQVGSVDPTMFQQDHHNFAIAIPQGGPLEMPVEPGEYNPHLQRSHTFPLYKLQDAPIINDNSAYFSYQPPANLNDLSHQMSYDSFQPQMAFTSPTSPQIPPGTSTFGPSIGSALGDSNAHLSGHYHNKFWPSDSNDHRSRTLDKADLEKDVILKPKKKQTMMVAANKLGLKWLRVRMNQVFL